MQIALLNGAAEAALAQYEVSSLDGLKKSDLQGKPCRDKKPLKRVEDLESGQVSLPRHDCINIYFG